MLTDVIVEEDFDKNGEPWYDPQDLERDLHLAAELGKTLLVRNQELEQAMKQMYSTNQEQLQEIEYLTKQVNLLRQMNDQHAKVYEQLDVVARDLEHGNHRLVQDNRLAQQKIHSLTETIEGLQTHMEDLQTRVEELKSTQADQNKRNLAEQQRSFGAQSVSCLKELYDLHHNRDLAYDSLHMDGVWSLQSSFLGRDRRQDSEQENASLKRSIQNLKSQIAVERSRREAAEQESELTIGENRGLEQRLALLDGCWARQKELEAEVEQLRLLWRSECATSFRRPGQLLLPDTVFFASEKQSSPGQNEMEENLEKDEEQKRYSRQRCNSDSILRATNADEIRLGHEQLCIRRAEAVKQRGISLLNEVDAQYNALQIKYDELLWRCQQATGQHNHKAIQTNSPYVSSWTRRRLSSSAAGSDLKVVLEDSQQPEYKALFNEIFTCIQKTKEDLHENRRPVKDGVSQGSAK